MERRRKSRASRLAWLDCIDVPANTGRKRGESRDALERAPARLNRAAGRPTRSPLARLFPRPNSLSLYGLLVDGSTKSGGGFTEGGGDPATKRVLGTTERLEPRRREPPPREGGRARYSEAGGWLARGSEREGAGGRVAQSERNRAQSQIRKPSDDINYILSGDGNESSAARRNITKLRCAFKSHPAFEREHRPKTSTPSRLLRYPPATFSIASVLPCAPCVATLPCPPLHAPPK